jgi:hypothetical protein
MKRLVLVLALLLAGCYEVAQEVIPAATGIELPIQSPITWDDGGRTEFTWVETTGDYRFVDKDGETGSARGIHIRDDLYLIQVRYDSEATYGLYFFVITPSRIDMVLPIDTVDDLAARYGVTLSDDDAGEFDYVLGGSPENIIAFLRAHAELEFDVP